MVCVKCSPGPVSSIDRIPRHSAAVSLSLGEIITSVLIDSHYTSTVITKRDCVSGWHRAGWDPGGSLLVSAHCCIYCAWAQINFIAGINQEVHDHCYSNWDTERAKTDQNPEIFLTGLTTPRANKGTVHIIVASMCDILSIPAETRVPVSIQLSFRSSREMLESRL